MADLGDLSDFLKEGTVADLGWLDIDEAKYRAGEYPAQGALPKQNLDIAPDMEALWAREDQPTTSYIVPNKQVVKPFSGAGEAHTMGDLSEAHGKLRARPEDIAKVTRYAMMQSHDAGHIRQALIARFDLETLNHNRHIVAAVLSERGLLGPIYIEAADFPTCTQSPKASTTFVRRYAGDAKYVLAKSQCDGCIHAHKIGTKTNCSVFHKELVVEVPYTEQLAQEIEALQHSRGKDIQPVHGLTAKERVKKASLAPTPKPQSSVYQGVGENQLPKEVKLSAQSIGERLIAASSLTRKRDEKIASDLKSKPIVDLVRRELLKGKTASDLAESLKVMFPMADLVQTRSAWEPLFKEAGLYGVIYSTQDSFNDCHEGVDFLAKHNHGVRAIVQGSKCGSCIYNKVGRCMMYGKPLIKDASELYTWPMVEAVMWEHKTSGRLPNWEKTAHLEATDPRAALAIIHAKVTENRGKPNGTAGRMDVFHQWVGGPVVAHQASALTKREIVRTASRFLNDGLYGKELLSALKSRFESRDLTASAPELRAVAAEQGLQGIYYVDPSIYDDYGHGCEEASRLFRARQIPYVKQQSKCATCVHNVNQVCSKLNKPLVADPPYVDKLAQQREILSSGPATTINIESVMAPSGLSMMAEYQLQNQGMDIELNGIPKASSLDIRIGRAKL